MAGCATQLQPSSCGTELCSTPRNACRCSILSHHIYMLLCMLFKASHLLQRKPRANTVDRTAAVSMDAIRS